MNATKVQRFLGYLIDIVIFSIIINLCVQGFYILIKFDTSNMTALYNSIMIEIEKYLNAAIDSGTFDSTALMNYLGEYFKYSLVNFGFNALFSFVFVVLYLIVLPKFWKGQTLGRFIMKTKVVNKDGSEAHISRIIVRELVGTWLLYMTIGGFSIVLATLILVICDGRSLVDYIGKTKLISLLDPENPVPNDSFENHQDQENNEYVDAKFKEVSKENDSSDDDEYKII